MGDFGSATCMSHDCTLQFLKSTQYKKLAPNALRFTYQNSKSCKPHEKQNKKHQNAKAGPKIFLATVFESFFTAGS